MQPAASHGPRQPKTVLIAEPHQLYSDALHALIEASGRYQVVGKAADGPDAMALHNKLRPDITLIRAELPGLNGVDAARQLLQDQPKAVVVVYAGDAEAWATNASFEAGARGCMLTSCSGGELLRALDSVSNGVAYLCPRLVDRLVEVKHAGRPAPKAVCVPPSPEVLTPKQREVLQRVAEGMGTKQIADSLGVSSRTIETHRTNITRKLGLHNAAQMTRYAIRHGIASAQA
ncbi:MAG: response regulator transcription factor [Phycisphaerales bacterium]|nr:response regulator transcription factor [Planctomycetota bacterium]MCH8507392.1 response regulator transcription factor [Phycisphaerales bacterium]